MKKTRTHPRPIWALALSLALIAALAACGSPREGGDDAGGSPDDVVSSTPDPNATPGDGGAAIVEPQPGQADVAPVAWQRAKATGNDTVKVTWWSGVEPCYVLDRVEVAYSEDAVAITLFEGHTPADEDVACIEIAMKKATIVTLDQPLGGRSIVDGAS